MEKNNNATVSSAEIIKFKLAYSGLTIGGSVSSYFFWGMACFAPALFFGRAAIRRALYTPEWYYEAYFRNYIGNLGALIFMALILGAASIFFLWKMLGVCSCSRQLVLFRCRALRRVKAENLGDYLLHFAKDVSWNMMGVAVVAGFTSFFFGNAAVHEFHMHELENKLGLYVSMALIFGMSSCLGLWQTIKYQSFRWRFKKFDTTSL